MVNLKSTMNQFSITKIYKIFIQQQDTTSSIQVPINYKPETLEHIQWHKIRCKIFMVYIYWNHTESILLSLWNYVRNQYQKIFENNPHIFKCNVTFTKKMFALVIESLNKVKRLKKTQRVIAEKQTW